MKSIYILDAVNYLFRSYYAIGGTMTNDKGQSTSALYGFIRSLQKLIRDFAPEYLIAVFDGPDNKKSRREVYAEYKMHRKGAPEDLFLQFEWAYEFCELAGIPAISVEGVEADDTMASITTFGKKKGAKVFLCSSDKDLMQLVDNTVSILHVHKDNLLIGPKEVEELYGVRPEQMLDLLAMMGDASDNIPGLPGFGAKTAAALLQEFGTLDELLAHPDKVKAPKKQEILRTHKELALMSRQLATLDFTIDIPHSEAFYRLKEPDRKNLSQFYQTMNFNSLLRDLTEKQPVLPKKKSGGKPDLIDYRLIDSEEELEQLFQFLEGKEICLDTETTFDRPMLAKLVGIGFCHEPGAAFYLPCNGNLGQERILSALRIFFQKKNAQFYGHNLKFDWHILQNYGIDFSISFDTLLASWLLTPQNRRHNLDDLTLERFQKVKISLTDLVGKGKKQISMFEAPIASLSAYCCEDVDYTARLKKVFSQELKDRGLNHLFYDLELPLLPILAKMERRGIFLDTENLSALGTRLTQAIGELKVRIFQEAGEEFNLNSPLQLSKILYEKMQLKPPGKKTETSTNAAVLEQLAIEHPFVQYILDYRTLEKLRSTYVEALPEAINPQTSRIHCTFNQSATATGRLSCQDPNLQNIPIRGVQGKEVRSCFKPQSQGWSYLSADYSQIELRLLAHFSEDPELLKAFQSGQDIHRHTASLVFNVPPSEVTDEMRSQAKAVNFGILYGQGAYGLSQQTGLSFSEAAAFIKTYFERYPSVSRYLESCREAVRRDGVALTLIGRQRPIPDIHNKNPAIRAAAERLAVNTPLQGTAADLIKKAMVEIEKLFEEHRFEGSMILQIHDELVFEIPDCEIEPIAKLVKEKMETVLRLNVPLEVAIGVGKNWGEC